MDDCRALAAWAEALPSRAGPAATVEQIEKHLEFLASALPSRTIDVETGRRRFAVYASMLAGLSDAALTHMSREACRTLDWFPTPKQCLDLAQRHVPEVSDRDSTLRLCARFAQAAMEQWLDDLGRGLHPGPAEPRWCRIAVERGLMIQLENSEYVSRALYHGPFRPWREAKFERKPINALIPNRDDYIRLFGIDPEVERAKAEAARVRFEAYDADLLRDSVSLQATLWHVADPTVVEEVR